MHIKQYEKAYKAVAEILGKDAAGDSIRVIVSKKVTCGELTFEEGMEIIKEVIR